MTHGPRGIFIRVGQDVGAPQEHPRVDRGTPFGVPALTGPTSPAPRDWRGRTPPSPLLAATRAWPVRMQTAPGGAAAVLPSHRHETTGHSLANPAEDMAAICIAIGPPARLILGDTTVRGDGCPVPTLGKPLVRRRTRPLDNGVEGDRGQALGGEASGCARISRQRGDQ